MISKGKIFAKELLRECGLNNIIGIDLLDFLHYRGIIYIEENMHNADGRIIHGKNKSVIKINKNISFEGRKRFAIAHELGHFEMHRDYPVHCDGKSLDWFDSALMQLKFGKQELEANHFASELLMPEKYFQSICKQKKFSPSLLRDLSIHFNTSITSVVFKCAELNIHPICVFMVQDGLVKYWKKADDFKYWIIDRNGMPPPIDSVAKEYIDSKYSLIYSKENSQQDIVGGAWFDITPSVESETSFYEYCICSNRYKMILSVVWVD